MVICLVQDYFEFLVRWNILCNGFLIGALWWFHFDGIVGFAWTILAYWWTRLIMIWSTLACFSRKWLQPIPHFISYWGKIAIVTLVTSLSNILTDWNKLTHFWQSRKYSHVQSFRTPLIEWILQRNVWNCNNWIIFYRLVMFCIDSEMWSTLNKSKWRYSNNKEKCFECYLFGIEYHIMMFI